MRRMRDGDSYWVEESLHNYWIDVEARDLWLRGMDADPIELDTDETGIEFMSATRTNMNLNLLRQESNDPVIVHMQTCGGAFIEGISIYDTIRSMPYFVTIISYTHARSMSSIVLQAGDLRLLAPNSYFLLHEGLLEVGGEYRTVLSNVEQSKLDNELMYKIYIARMKESKKFGRMSISKIRKYLINALDEHRDVFLNPQEAITWGFADGILQGWTKDNEVIY